ncbi:hypothetical protein L1987_40341 [Smallanthus sonchifolius]|uniref:Uncharacterized protein n=1 Tax=Smallanthus sonchifolius TaxID=185202 RepID=A0ACB9GU50_9ASTR|nr:hypothetical protein L1987_40341 [Smallanthus sonchifolius]
MNPRIITHCTLLSLWRTSFVRKVCREGEYYEDMIGSLRKNLADVADLLSIGKSSSRPMKAGKGLLNNCLA